MMNVTLTSKSAVILLAGLISARATGYLFTKFCFLEMEPLFVLACRNLIAVVVLLPFLYKHLLKMSLRDAVVGCGIGLLFTCTMVTEFFGLVTTDISVAAILENTAIVMVPIIAAVVSRRLPDLWTLVCCLLALGGVVAMSWTGATLHLAVGEWLLLLAAFFYASSIVAMARLTHGCDALLVGFFQIVTMGVLSLTGSFLFESPSLPTQLLTYECLIYLAVVCSSFGFTLQPLAQTYCSAETAGLLCALSPLIGMVLGVVVLGEPLTVLRIVGLVLILSAILLYARVNNRPTASQTSHT